MKLSSKKKIEYDILYKSLIGKEIEITDSKNKNQIGIKGKILQETANFFVIDQKGSIIRIHKENITFKLIHKEKALYIDGRLLLSTLTQRIKKIK